MADKAADIDHVWKLIEDIPIAMVVTHEGQGQNMRARPWPFARLETKAQSFS